MIEWKTIKIEDKNFIGMHLILPHQQMFIISSTKCILLGDAFLLDNMTKNACIFIMEKADSFEAMLSSQVKQMNKKAEMLGYHNAMKGKEVLLYQSENKTKK